MLGSRRTLKPPGAARWGVLGGWLLAAALCGRGTAALAAEAAGPKHASSEIRRESNGIWLYVDGKKTPAVAGAVYQNTEGNRHIRSYDNTLHSLYAPLDDEVAGGQGHGARLERMAITAVRVYELPVENEEDAERVKEIFRRLYYVHHIKVLVGDWAGLNSGMNLKDPSDLARLRTHIRKLVDTYAGENWVLGWQLGNENNYHIRNGLLGDEIGLDLAEYYAFMDNLAGVMKAELAAQNARQIVTLGQGDLKDEEAQLIGQMTNFDAVGINCYRKDANSFEDLINLANARLRVPIYFAEIGRPAEGSDMERQQSEYLREILQEVYSHSAGRVRTGSVIGAFIHEATDELWKRTERGHPEDAHYGFLGKQAESEIGRLLNQKHDFDAWILPPNDSPDSLINSAWQCLEGPYSRKYTRDYGYALAYAGRVITLYKDTADKEQASLVAEHAPPSQAAGPGYWALNTVGTGYFIMGDAWMLLSYDFQGSEPPRDWWPKLLQMADVHPDAEIAQRIPEGAGPTNAAGCRFYAQQMFAFLRQRYPYANLRELNGSYWELDRAINVRFPELLPEYIPLTWQNCAIFTGGGLFLIVALSALIRGRAARKSVKSKPAIGPGGRFLFLVALAFNLASLFWMVNWWFHPVRMRYYTVQPVLYWMLSGIGALGVLFYFCVWFFLWNMRRPVPMKPKPGLRVAMVTTRVASEPVEHLEATLEKMSTVTYPHDSFLLDEEDNPEAAQICEKWGVTHFSRKGVEKYNQPRGNFQARTKGGNLNSWLDSLGGQYEFVTFLDPDHGPRPEFLDRVLGYFEKPSVGFVQGPQVFHNSAENWITRGASEQSYFFYGPMEMGLFGAGACVVNGSHSTFRVSDLFALRGGSYAVHDADDILTSLRMHGIKKTGVYVPEVLAEGLAPDNWDEFSKQQRRWAYSMFHLFFHYYPRELWRVPLRCKVAYLLLAAFYFRGAAFAGLLLLPFISAVTGNPPVNANVTAFCFRFLPFFAIHYGILLLMGQRFLVPGGSRKGFWFRGGILWVAMWWYHLCALWKGFWTRGVPDRMVAAKWKPHSASPWRAIRPHLALAGAAAIAIAWTVYSSGRRETVLGNLIFLSVVLISQSVVVCMVVSSSRRAARAREPERRSRAIPIAPLYSQQPRKL